MTLKERHTVCPTCDTHYKGLHWDGEIPTTCQKCGGRTQPFTFRLGNSPMITTDDIPGGIEIHNAICWPDGTPKRYYSKSDIKRAANKAGYTIHGDTPKPYKVVWDGKQERIDGVRG